MQAAEGKGDPCPSEEGRGKRQKWGEWEKAGRERLGKKKKGAFGNQRMEPMFKYIWSSSIDHFVNETRKRGKILIDFVLSLSLSTSVKSWRKFAGSGWMRCTPRRKSVLTHFPRCVSYLEEGNTHTHTLYSTTSEAYTSAINRHTQTWFPKTLQLSDNNTLDIRWPILIQKEVLLRFHVFTYPSLHPCVCPSSHTFLQCGVVKFQM